MLDPKLLLTYEKRKAMARVVKRHRKPPVWLHPTPVERYYAGILLSYVRFMEEQTRQILIPALPGLEQEANNAKPKADRADDYSDNVTQIMNTLSLSIDKNNPIPSIPTMTLDIGQKTSKWNSAQWQKTMKQVTGVNTAQYEPWLQSQLKSFSVENVALIKSLKDQSLSNIETMTQRALRSGMRHEEIAQQIEGQFDTTRSRAKLIARDQVSKLNGQLTQLRQNDIGINEYIWRTSGDERVRADHRANDGKKMKWDDPTVYWSGTAWVPRTGFRGIPGEDYQCRCWAEPVFDSIYESIDQGTYVSPGAPVAPEVVKTTPIQGTSVPYVKSGKTMDELMSRMDKKYPIVDNPEGLYKKQGGTQQYYKLFSDSKPTGFYAVWGGIQSDIADALKKVVTTNAPIENISLAKLYSQKKTVLRSDVQKELKMNWMKMPGTKPLVVEYINEYGKKYLVMVEGEARIMAAKAHDIRKLEVRMLKVSSSAWKIKEAQKAALPAMQHGFNMTTKVATPVLKDGTEFIKMSKSRNIGNTFGKGVEDVDTRTLGAIAERMTWYRANFNMAVEGYGMLPEPVGNVCATMSWENILKIGSIKNFDHITRVAASQSSHWPKGCTTLKSVIDHEMGHAIHNKYITDSTVKAIIAYRDTLTDLEVINGLSKYAISPVHPEHRLHEFIAESWAEYTNTTAPRPIAKKVGDLIMKGWKV